MERFSRIGAGYIATCIVGGIAVTGGGILAPESAGLLRTILIVAGLAAIVIGIGGIIWDIRAWQADRMARLSAIAASASVGPLSTQSNWLPDPTNLLSLQMTNEDLDACLERARSYAKDLFAADARAYFVYVHMVLPDIDVLFAGDSKYAGQSALIHVREESITHDPSRNWAWHMGSDPGGYGDFDYDEGLPPWQRDGAWRELVTQVWGRIRPFEGSMELEALARGDEGWRVSAVGGGQPERMFYLRDGVLLEWKFQEDPPKHALAMVGQTLTCVCGAEFTTGPEFEAHRWTAK